MTQNQRRCLHLFLFFMLLPLIRRRVLILSGLAILTLAQFTNIQEETIDILFSELDFSVKVLDPQSGNSEELLCYAQLSDD